MRLSRDGLPGIRKLRIDRHGLHRGPGLHPPCAGYLTDDEYRRLQEVLLTNPEAGTVMPGTGGFRKTRWRDPRRGKGSRGGLRVIYYHFANDAQVWLMTLYDKDELTDLTPAAKRALRAAINAEREVRAAQRLRTRKR
jgi:hypothetical protein